MDPDDGRSSLPPKPGERRTSPPPPSSAPSWPATRSRPAPRPAFPTSPGRTAGWPGCERCSRAGTTADNPQGARVHPDTRAEWRAWLAGHHDGSDGVWLVLWRKQSGRTGLTYEEAVQEALCFGWIDSKGSKLDDERTMLWMSPRKRGSGWARTYKVRIEQRPADGLMTPAGLALIEEAKRDGSWTLLDDVENLVVPDDLAAALEAHPGAGERGTRALPLGAPGRAGADRPGQAPRDPGQAGRRVRPCHRPGRAARPVAARFLTPSPLPAQRRMVSTPTTGRPWGRRGRLQHRLAPGEQPHLEQAVELLARHPLGQRDELPVARGRRPSGVVQARRIGRSPGRRPPAAARGRPSPPGSRPSRVEQERRAGSPIDRAQNGRRTDGVVAVEELLGGAHTPSSLHSHSAYGAKPSLSQSASTGQATLSPNHWWASSCTTTESPLAGVVKKYLE